jgi:hypothetical protein
LESICAFKSISTCLMKSGTLTLGAYKLIIVLMYCPFYSYEMSSFVLFDQCKFEIYFVWYKYCYFCLFSGAISLVNHLSVFHPKPLFISVNNVGLL